jgi:hypothetical protein
MLQSRDGFSLAGRQELPATMTRINPRISKPIMHSIIPTENIKSKIFIIRGQKVMLDFDLANLYEVETRRLNEQVKRNIRRFPEEFMFQLTRSEFEGLISQIAISNDKSIENKHNLMSQNVTSKRGGTRKLPFVFTEHGVAMLSSVLKSEKAVQINIAIIKTFIKLRDFALSYSVLAEKIVEIESQYKKQNKQITEIFVALHLLAKGEEKEEIGFKAD